MDSLTHLVLGAALGEAVLGNKIGRKAMLLGAIANTIPDFDVFTSPCVSDAQQMLIHRGVTHSFFFAIVIAFILAWCFKRWSTHLNVSFKDWYILFVTGMLTHDILDSMTCYGTAWFEPFSDYRVAFDTIFVADPFFTIPFLICLIIALIAKNGSEKRVAWNRAGLLIASSYLLFTLINKAHVHNTIAHSLESQRVNVSDYVTTPTPLNNFLWMTYATAIDSSGYWIGYYSIFDKGNNIAYYHIPKNEYLLKPYENREDLHLLKKFSEGYYCASREEDIVYFNDLRFGQIAGWNEPDSSFVYAFNLTEGADNSGALNRDKHRTGYAEVLKGMVGRIIGD